MWRLIIYICFEKKTLKKYPYLKFQFFITLEEHYIDYPINENYAICRLKIQGINPENLNWIYFVSYEFKRNKEYSLKILTKSVQAMRNSKDFKEIVTKILKNLPVKKYIVKDFSIMVNNFKIWQKMMLFGFLSVFRYTYE